MLSCIVVDFYWLFWYFECVENIVCMLDVVWNLFLILFVVNVCDEIIVFLIIIGIC